MQVVSLRSFKQSHADIFSRLIAFAIVARAAAGDEVIPARIAAARAGMYVIEREFLRRKYSATVLAGIVIAQKDVFA